MIGVRTYGRCVNILCCGVVGTPVVLVTPGVGFGVRELVLPLSAGAVDVSLLEPLPMLSLEDMVVSVGHFWWCVIDLPSGGINFGGISRG